MSRLARFRCWLQSVPSRIVGSHVDVENEVACLPPAGAEFPIDELLERRIRAARQALPDNSVKALHRRVDAAERALPAAVDEIEGWL